MIAKKKNLSVRWAAAAVIALLLAGCASLPAKSASGPAGQASQSHPSLAALSASSELELNNMVSTKALSINTPASWGYEIAPDGGVNFKRNADYDIGGIYLQPYNSADGQYILTLLPNHSEVTCRKALSGFYTGAEEIDLTTTQPAAAGAPDPLYWTYIFIEDKNNNVIFELFFNKAYASETDAVAVAKTLKCVSAPADSNAPNDNNFDNFVGFVNNYGYKILTNSLTGGYALQIPGSFSAVKNGYAIGKFLEARNGLSKQYGLDFSSYIGKTLTLYTCDGEMRDNGDSALTEDTGGPGTRNIVGLFDGSRLVGFWAAPQAAAEKTNEDWEILNRYLGTGAQ